MKKNLLELFSGTGSVGKVAKDNYNVISLDRDMEADIKEDIMTWDYKKYPKDYFYIITASPVCLWWSRLRNCWIGRKCKTIHPTEIITKDHIMEDINKYGKPMVDKIFEIINYFNPAYWWIENPSTGKMKHYIASNYPEYNTFYDVDYCKYSDYGYNKKTRLYRYSAILPLKILLQLTLDDKVIVGTRLFTINSMTTKLQSGETEFELLNEAP